MLGIGCRGHVSQPYEWMCKVLGLTKEERKKLNHEVGKAELHSSHAIVAPRCQREQVPKLLPDDSD